MFDSAMDDFVNEVRERSDIREVISRYVTLNFKGGRYWACCPFHNEKTPSFTVSPDKGMFYCFGCHTGGNVFKFLSLIENVSYFDAIKLQAERLGIDLPSHKKTAAELKLEQKQKTLFKIMTLAQDFYHNNLVKTAAGETGRKYLEARGITSGVIEKFKLGYAPDSWDALTKALKSRGFDDRYLFDAGIVSRKQDGAGVYDRLRGRVIIPINDINGNVVAFGGRILGEGEPKYLNTPDTVIFSKGKLLFGLDKANRAIMSADCAVIVEGYMDAISLISAGIENVVATLGTAFSDNHARLLTRYTRRIILCYDSDEAGQRATIRALPMIQKAGAEVFVAVVPDGKDPDEFVRKHGKAAFENLLKNALPFFEYKLQYVMSHADIYSYQGKIRALRELLPVLAEIKDVMIQTEYRQKISAALVLDENIILDELHRFLANAEKKLAKKINPIAEKPEAQENILARQAGSSIIKKAWYEGDVLSYVLGYVPKEIFLTKHREILSYLEKCHEMGKHPNDLSAADELSEAANAELSRILASYPVNFSAADDKAYEDSLKVMRLIYVKSQYENIRREVEESYNSGDEAAYLEKLQRALEIQREMEELKFA